MNLEKIREKIDFIDDQIINLLIQRYDLVLEVKTYKKAHQVPVLDTNRENEIISKLKQKKYHEQLENIFQNIMALSKDLQKQ